MHCRENYRTSSPPQLKVKTTKVAVTDRSITITNEHELFSLSNELRTEVNTSKHPVQTTPQPFNWKIRYSYGWHLL